MIKYYTRACNFYHGNQAKILIKSNLALPLCGNSQIAFDHIEIFSRKNKKISSKILHLNNVKNLKPKEDHVKKKKFLEICKF